MNSGTYRIINIDNSAILETKISLDDGKNLEPTMRRKETRWQIELFGGFAIMNPEDLNLRAQFDDMYNTFYTDDFFRYLENQGEITSFEKTNEGLLEEKGT